MGFLGKIFGKAKPKRVELEFEKADSFLEKELSGKRKSLLDKSAGKLAEIKHLLREIEASLKGLEQAKAVERGGKRARLDKIAGTAKSNVLKQLHSLVNKLSPPNTSDLFHIREYCFESLQILQQSGNFVKNVAYTGISFKDEMKLIGNHVKHLNKAFISLKELFEENKAVFLKQGFDKKLVEIVSVEKSVDFAEKELASLSNKLEQQGLEESRLKTKLEKLREGDEFRSIDSLNEKKAELLREKQNAKTELLDLFAKIEKPLHRLDKAVSARKVFLEGKHASFLHELLLNPFRALKLDPKAEILKQVLIETKKAIESGLIELKDREKEKKLNVLQELLSFDFFSEAFWKFNGFDSDILAIEKKLAELPALKEETALLASLRLAEQTLSATRGSIAQKEDFVKKARQSIRETKLEIQSLLSKATEKEVVLKA